MEKGIIKNNIIAVASRHDQIKLAYLFGSTAREDGGKLSDIDIAVYFDGADKRQMAELKLKLLAELSQALETDQIDLVVLNTTEQPELKYQIISEGELICEREPYKIMVEPLILNEYFDFQMILRRYGLTRAWSMSNLTVIENKISAARKYLKILEEFSKYSREEIEKDVNIRGAAERYLYLAVQASIDLAEALIAYKKFRKPTTLSETFHILNEEKIIDTSLTDKLASMVGFRNIITHDYGKIDYDIVYDVLHNRLEDIDRFLNIAEQIR